MADRRDEFGNPIRRTDEEELTGYPAGPQGYEPYGTTGYGVSTGGLHNPPESQGFGSEGGQQQQQMRPGQQPGYGSGQMGHGSGQTGHGSGQSGYRRQEGGKKE